MNTSASITSTSCLPRRFEHLETKWCGCSKFEYTVYPTKWFQWSTRPSQRVRLGRPQRTPTVQSVPPWQPLTQLTSTFLGSGGRSGPWNRGRCRACPYLMPSCNRIGSYDLEENINCDSSNVVFASICNGSCALVCGLGHTIGTFRETIEMLQPKTKHERTLLSRWINDHNSILVGLNTYTNDEDRLQKIQKWESNLRAMLESELL